MNAASKSSRVSLRSRVHVCVLFGLLIASLAARAELKPRAGILVSNQQMGGPTREKILLQSNAGPCLQELRMNGSNHCPLVVQVKRGFRQVLLAGRARHVNLVKTRLFRRNGIRS